MRILGIDLGTKTAGIAVSDEAGLTAQPLITLKRVSTAKLIAEILKLAEEYSAGAFVVGMPVNMNGTMGPRSELVEKFVDKLSKQSGIPVYFWDERLSTVAVTRVLIEGNMSRARRKEVVDKMAASYILQGFLDSRKKTAI